MNFYKNFRLKNRISSRENLVSTIKSNFGVVKGLMELKKMSPSKISYQSLVKVMLLSALLMLILIRLHPRSRSLLVQILNGVAATALIGGFFGSGAFILYKNSVLK